MIFVLGRILIHIRCQTRVFESVVYCQVLELATLIMAETSQNGSHSIPLLLSLIDIEWHSISMSVFWECVLGHLTTLNCGHISSSNFVLKKKIYIQSASVCASVFVLRQVAVHYWKTVINKAITARDATTHIFSLWIRSRYRNLDICWYRYFSDIWALL